MQAIASGKAGPDLIPRWRYRTRLRYRKTATEKNSRTADALPEVKNTDTPGTFCHSPAMECRALPEKVSQLRERNCGNGYVKNYWLRRLRLLSQSTWAPT